MFCTSYILTFVFFSPRFVFVFCFSQLCIRERESFATDLEQDEASISSLGKSFGGDLHICFSSLPPLPKPTGVSFSK